MSDCISRQAVQDYIAKYLDQFLYNDVREAIETIDAYIGEMPSVTPTERTGHWIEVVDFEGTFEGDYAKMCHYECSECGNFDNNLGKDKFCRECGAKMEGE